MKKNAETLLLLFRSILAIYFLMVLVGFPLLLKVSSEDAFPRTSQIENSDAITMMVGGSNSDNGSTATYLIISSGEEFPLMIDVYRDVEGNIRYEDVSLRAIFFRALIFFGGAFVVAKGVFRLFSRKNST